MASTEALKASVYGGEMGKDVPLTTAELMELSSWPTPAMSAAACSATEVIVKLLAPSAAAKNEARTVAAAMRPTMIYNN